MLNYVSINVTDLERSGAFYDTVLSPLGWRRQIERDGSIGWGLVRPVFYVRTGEPNTAFGTVSFPTKAIPAVKASWESALEAGDRARRSPAHRRLRETLTTRHA